MPGHVLDIVHLLQKLPKLLDVQRFLKDFIEPTLNSFIHVLVLNMPSYSYNLGLLFLRKVHLSKELSYFLGCFIPIHKWHVAIHQDKPVLIRLIVLHTRLYLL